MGATYTRQSSSGITDGSVIEASDLNAEFDQLLAAFVAASGHTHDGTAAEGGPVTKLLGTAITIGDATAGTDIAVTFDGETSDGVLTWMEDEDHFKFSDDVVVDSTKKLYFYDEGGEYISGDGTDLTLTSGADINIPSSIGLTFGNDGEKIEGDGTDLTITGNTINLTATTDVALAVNTGLLLAGTEKIESDGTDLSITVGASGDINIGSDIGMTFGDDGEKIEGDGTDLTILSSGVLNIAAGGTTNQIKVTDGTITPIADNDIDLGTASLEFKNVYVDGTTYTDAIGFGTVSMELPVADGSSNQVLKTDGSGNLDWATISAGTITALNNQTANRLTTIGSTTTELDGEANLTFTGSALTCIGTVTVGVNDAGHDVKFFGDTASAYMLWDTSADDLVLAGAAGIDLAGDIDVDGTANLDAVDIDGAVQIDGTVTVGVDGTGLDVKFFGDTAGSFALWDESADALLLTDSTPIQIGDSQDLTLYHDGSNSFITNAQGALKVATETSGIAVSIGHTTSETTVNDNFTVTGTLTGTLATAAQGSVTSLGTLTTLTVDNVIINGTTIGHTSDTDLLTLTSGVLTVAGEVSATTLDIGGTNIGSTAAELNFLDGSAKSTSSITVADADALIVIDGTTTKQIPASDMKTYIGGGTSWQAVKTANFTAAAGQGVFANTTSSAWTVTLPAGTIGDEVSIIDYAGTFDSYNLTVAADGSEKIHGSTDDLTVATERAGFTLVYTDGTQGWLLKDK